MPLTSEQVRHVAELAKLDLSAEEVEMFREQLSAILDYAARLNQLDTSAIPPTASVALLCNVMRQDVVEQGLSQSDALANAPATEGSYFQVKAILE